MTHLKMMSSTVQNLQHDMIPVDSWIDRITPFQFWVIVPDKSTRQKTNHER